MTSGGSWLFLMEFFSVNEKIAVVCFHEFFDIQWRFVIDSKKIQLNFFVNTEAARQFLLLDRNFVRILGSWENDRNLWL